MAYRALADLVLALHLAFIAFVLFGGLLALRWPRAALIHLPAALWGAVVEFTGLVCPLTPLENALRRSAGAVGYSDGFIEHYVSLVVYPPGLSRGHQLLLALLVVVVNALVYSYVWRRHVRAGRGLAA